MKSGLLVACLTVGALLVVSTHSWSQTDPPRTAWGAPDLRGIWNHGTATPLERPERHAGREFLTDEEIAVNAEARSTEGVGARRAVWWERGFGWENGAHRRAIRWPNSVYNGGACPPSAGSPDEWPGGSHPVGTLSDVWRAEAGWTV